VASRRYVVIDRSTNKLVHVVRPGGLASHVGHLSSFDPDELYDMLCALHGDPDMAWMRDRFVLCPAAGRSDATGDFITPEELSWRKH